MRSRRQTDIRRALLQVLALMPEGVLIPDRLLFADAQRAMLPPAPTVAELETEIREADAARLIVSVLGEDAVIRKLSAAGRAWLAEHP